MIIGMSVATFTLLHVLISLVGIVAGAAALGEMIAGRRLGLWNTAFFIATAATSITGFFFHSASFGPPHVIGLISIVVLSIALFAFKVRALAGIWRPIYAVAATVALYLNAFVGVVQAFQKLSALKELAPTQTEPPFLVAQSLLLIAFAIVGFVAVKRLPRSEPGVSRQFAR
jgi:hypothetical protein